MSELYYVPATPDESPEPTSAEPGLMIEQYKHAYAAAVEEADAYKESTRMLSEQLRTYAEGIMKEPIPWLIIFRHPASKAPFLFTDSLDAPGLLALLDEVRAEVAAAVGEEGSEENPVDAFS
ncbi:MAG: hypothetical protein AB7Q01_08440 [Gammaproteobacteria bacterium]